MYEVHDPANPDPGCQRGYQPCYHHQVGDNRVRIGGVMASPALTRQALRLPQGLEDCFHVELVMA
ncbi:MAG: hypothetical protein ACLS88_10295 [Faecalibacterium sp.]